MIYREYGKTGKKLSIVGFGGMRFKDIKNSDRCVEMLVEAGKAGINYFDTAPKYFNTRSEEIFGEGLTELKRLGLPFYCATKTFAAGEAEIREELEGQLRRLHLDKIDFYHIWCVTSLEDWQARKEKGILKTFQKLKEEGLIEHICVSSHLIGDQIKEVLREDILEGVLFGYSAHNFAFRQKAFDTIAERDLGCAVMNPLGGGIIPQNPEIFNFLRTNNEVTVVEAALHFLFAHERINTALVGFGELKEIREAAGAVDSFSEVKKEEIERIKDSLPDSFQNLCTGCQYCDGCPEDIPIPKLMDAYNHKMLYGKDSSALDRLKYHWSIPISEAAKCTACGQCEEDCTQHLAIIERLKEIAALEEQ